MLSKQNEEWLFTGMVRSVPFACPNMLESYACNFADCFQVSQCHASESQFSLAELAFLELAIEL